MKALALLTAAALSLLSVAAPHKPTRTAKAKLRRRRRLLRKASVGDWGDRPLCRSPSFWAGLANRKAANSGGLKSWFWGGGRP